MVYPRFARCYRTAQLGAVPTCASVHHLSLGDQQAVA